MTVFVACDRAPIADEQVSVSQFQPADLDLPVRFQGFGDNGLFLWCPMRGIGRHKKLELDADVPRMRL